MSSRTGKSSKASQLRPGKRKAQSGAGEKAQHRQRFLTLDELSPTVDLASCFRWEEAFHHRYRIPSHHLLLIASGTIEAKTPTQTIQAKAGDLICFRPTDWNEYANESTAVIYEIHLEFARPPKQDLTPMLNEFGPLPLHIPLGDAFIEMRRIFEAFCIEITKSDVQHLLRMKAGVHEMLAIIASVLKHDVQSISHLDPWQRLRLRLDTELHTGCNVEKLASEMHLSRRYFSRIFRKRFGMTPKTYQIYVRLQEAARLLRGSDKPIKEISYDLGFKDARILTRLCKRHLGVLPSDLRLGKAVTGTKSTGKTPRLFQMNTHLLPPHTDPNWKGRYTPRHHADNYVMSVPSEQEKN